MVEPVAHLMRPTIMSRIHVLAVDALTTRALVAAIGLIVALAITTAGSPYALASPRHPGDGDRITVVLTSDRKINSGVSWYDGHNRLRSQTRVPLDRYHPTSKTWSASLVYTSRARNQKVDTVFQSAGAFARCTVWVNTVKVREKTVRGQRYATASCR